MINSIRINLEKILFALAIVLALAVRLLDLGSLPLSDAEATLALQGVDIAQGQLDAVQGDPAYVLLTGGLFFFTQASDFFARFWPAVLGGLLPLAAYYFRGMIGKRPALFLAFGLALDPGLVAISRQASGSGMAAMFVIFCAGLAINSRSLAFGFFAGLSLLSGVGLWPGLLVLAVASFLFWRAVDPVENTCLDWKHVGFGLLAALLGVGTLMFTTPIGLGGIGNSLGQYFSGWQNASREPVSLAQMLLSLPIYHTLPFVFGLVAIIRALFNPEDRVGHLLSSWFGLALIFALIYPSRQITDLTWCVIALWFLAARELGRIRFAWKETHRTEIGYAILVVILSIFLHWSLVSIPNPLSMTDASWQTAFFRLIAGLGLFILTFGLVVWGWGIKSASSGLRLGVLVLLSFGLISSMWNAAGLAGSPETEMWRTAEYPKEARLLQKTLDDLSAWTHHSPNQFDVAIVGVKSDSLVWFLRDYPEVRQLEAIAVEDTPSIVITPAQASLGQASAYRGQDFVWSSTPAWSSLSPYEYVRWLLFRQVRMENEYITVWVRVDLFPGEAGK